LTASVDRRARPVLIIVTGVAVALAVVTAALVVGPGRGLLAVLSRLEIRPHAPDVALVAAAPPAVQVHLAAALAALTIGTVLLLGVKGTTLHRTLGWTWVIAMAATAISSLFIRELNHGAFSFIHLLAGWTLISLPMAVYAARRHKVAQHRQAMTGLFLGGLILAGLLAFLPGRLLWEMFF
jgi:uncharacterized membrane protein